MIGSRAYNPYSCPIPQIPQNAYNFNMTVNAPDGIYTYYFTYIGTNVEGVAEPNWYFTCTLPSGVIRWGKVNPNAICWSQSPDVGVVFITSLSTIGQNDFVNLQMYNLYWLVP